MEKEAELGNGKSELLGKSAMSQWFSRNHADFVVVFLRVKVKGVKTNEINTVLTVGPNKPDIEEEYVIGVFFHTIA